MASAFRSCCSDPLSSGKQPCDGAFFSALMLVSCSLATLAERPAAQVPHYQELVQQLAGRWVAARPPPPPQALCERPQPSLNEAVGRDGPFGPCSGCKMRAFCRCSEGLPGKRGGMCQRDPVSHSFPEQRMLPPARWNREHGGQCTYSKAFLTTVFNHLCKHLVN